MLKVNKILYIAQIFILLGSLSLFYKIGDQLDIENKKITSDVVFHSVKLNYKDILSDSEKIFVEWSDEIKNSSNENYCNANTIKNLTKDKTYISYGVGDLKGKVICSSLPLPKDFNLSERTPSYNDVINHKEIEITEFGITQSTKEGRVALGYPMYDINNNVKGVLYLTLRLSSIEDSLKQLLPNQKSQLLITDKQGTILVTSPSNQEFIGKKVLSSTDLSLLLSKKEGQLIIKENKKNMLYTFSALGIVDNHPDVGFIIYKIERKNALLNVTDAVFIAQLIMLSTSIVLLSGIIFTQNRPNTKNIKKKR